MYPAFCRELLDETGIDPEYDACGELEIAMNEDALRSLRDDAQAGAEMKTPDGSPAYVLHEPASARRLEPLVSEQALGALEVRQTAQVRNPRLLRALTTSCVRSGVTLRENTPAHDLELTGDRVTGVVTNGGVLRADRVVLCAGAWSSQISGRLAELMPVHPVRGQVVLMKFEARALAHVIARGKTYLVPRRDGHVILGATEEHRSGFSKRNTAKGIAGLIEKGVQLVPSIADAQVEATWAGLRPGTPDDNPYIGAVPGLDGLIAATGHFRAGLILAPITSEIVAELATPKTSGNVPAGGTAPLPTAGLDLSACRSGRQLKAAP